ncbi:alpha-actinin-like protein 1 [Aspergillus udagawae]|uniref:Alpha-actinin-like protein 1 n=1 Tax=Aspergillus udagawae TaxID=91492 RepID=A0A8H3S186_9EURO|nr:alpha-actinin-like protein 1 [Aspergillus udagawae]
MLSSSELALTSLYPPTDFTSFQALKDAVTAKATSLRRGEHHQYQYISLKHVARRDFEGIEANRQELGSVVRLTYFPDIQNLIIKVPTREHEIAHTNIGQFITRKVDRMNIPFVEFVALGATKYTGPTSSSKECDSSWTNTLLRPRGWPYMVIEAGVSESMPRLWADAAWWFVNSNGAVRLVLLIKIDVQRKMITMEKYDRTRGPTTRSNPQGGPWRPRKLTTVTINQQVNPANIQVDGRNATSRPLTLEFELVFGRPPNPPLESDITFTNTELLEWSRVVFL